MPCEHPGVCCGRIVGNNKAASALIQPNFLPRLPHLPSTLVNRKLKVFNVAQPTSRNCRTNAAGNKHTCSICGKLHSRPRFRYPRHTTRHFRISLRRRERLPERDQICLFGYRAGNTKTIWSCELASHGSYGSLCARENPRGKHCRRNHRFPRTWRRSLAGWPVFSLVRSAPWRAAKTQPGSRQDVGLPVPIARTHPAATRSG